MFLVFVSALACFSTTASAAAGSQFWGYGTNISGLPLFYADGVAYVGTAPPPAATVATNITLVTQSVDDGTFVASPNDTSLDSGNWTSTALFIDNNQGAFATAGFTSESNTTITTTGFDLWGTMLVWVSESGDITAKWYADKVDENLWVVKWNVDNVSSDTAIPLVLKSLPPPASKRR